MTPAEFEARWCVLVTEWAARRRDQPGSAEELLRSALERGVSAMEPPTEATAPDEEQSLACAMALIELSGTFDSAGYETANLDVAQLRSGRITPLRHFCENGWEWLRNPRADFDLWWYWNEYLDPTSTAVNPFLHYLLAGRQAGLPGRPERQPARPGAPTAPDGTRRVCLFAAYDADGIVDDYVVDYLHELSRYADVFYLADATMSDDELAKLADVTVAAWAVPHGRYDFGSFAMLAAELVGWDRIDTYDELLLANDSCYLLRPLADTFARMDTRPADWWGLQATKRDYAPEHGFDEPLPLDRAKTLHTDRADWYPWFRLHLSSYLLVLRKRVMNDEGFRRRLSTVVPQSHKGLIILKYEIGLSDYLLQQGYDFETYVDALYPFHPLYSGDYFTLARDGFPLLKRNFIGENSRYVPEVHRWKERILEASPTAPVDVFERNLLRVTPDNLLQRSFRVRTRPDGTVDEGRPIPRRAFRAADLATPTYDHWWAFPVCAYEHTFASNERAVFEEVRDDPSIKKIVLTRSRRVEVTGANVVVAPMDSPEGQYHLLRSGQVFVKHGPYNVTWPMATTIRNVINLWHGVPLKRFGLASLGLTEDLRRGHSRNNAGCRAVVTSSKMDTLAMSAAFFPASYPDLWPTGLPRNDFVLRADDRLPADLRASVEQLRAEVGGRRLVMFLPTFKDGQAEAYYHFTEAEVERLGAWAKAHNVVLAVREHMADKAHTYSRMLAPLDPIDLSARRYPDLEVLYRVADALISDYSSCLVDFLMTGKPVISFAYDYARYAGSERGLFYSLDRVLPGPVCRSFDELATALDQVFEEPSAAQREEYEWRRRIFIDHVDDGASARVVRRVKELYLPDA